MEIIRGAKTYSILNKTIKTTKHLKILAIFTTSLAIYYALCPKSFNIDFEGIEHKGAISKKKVVSTYCNNAVFLSY
jgi:hypothetical protein